MILKCTDMAATSIGHIQPEIFFKISHKRRYQVSLRYSSANGMTSLSHTLKIELSAIKIRSIEGRNFNV